MAVDLPQPEAAAAFEKLAAAHPDDVTVLRYWTITLQRPTEPARFGFYGQLGGQHDSNITAALDATPLI